MDEPHDLTALTASWLAASANAPMADPFGDPSWVALSARLSELTMPSRRPDLYVAGVWDSKAISVVTGLEDLARAAARGVEVPADQLARDLANFVTRPLPPIETWILLDADLPLATDISLGAYRLFVPGHAALAALPALPRLARYLPAPELDPKLLGESAFLRVPAPVGHEYSRGRLYFTDLDRRPERPHADVLLTLQLWNLTVSAHPEGYYQVEAGRHVRRTGGGATIEPAFDPLGEEVGEIHRRYGPHITAEELTAFADFCTQIHTMITTVRARTNSKATAPSGTAAALASASTRLLRAAQRTYGGTFVDETDAEDVLLDYVVAIEALLTYDGRSDKRRTSRQRAAALYAADNARLDVYQVVGRAYTQRSRYAHGEQQKPLTGDDMNQTRRVAFSVFLRWLICTSQHSEDILKRLDESLLSAAVRQEVITGIEQHLTDHPAAPAD